MSLSNCLYAGNHLILLRHQWRTRRGADRFTLFICRQVHRLAEARRHAVSYILPHNTHGDPGCCGSCFPLGASIEDYDCQCPLSVGFVHLLGGHSRTERCRVFGHRGCTCRFCNIQHPSNNDHLGQGIIPAVPGRKDQIFVRTRCSPVTGKIVLNVLH